VLGDGCHAGIVAGSKQDVLLHDVGATDAHLITCPSQCPDPLAFSQHTGGVHLQLVSLSKLAEELQNLTRLDDPIVLRHHSKGRFGVRPEQHMTLRHFEVGVGVVRIAGHSVAHLATQDFIVQSRVYEPVIEGRINVDDVLLPMP